MYVRYCAKQKWPRQKNITPYPQEAQSPLKKMSTYTSDCNEMQ